MRYWPLCNASLGCGQHEWRVVAVLDLTGTVTKAQCAGQSVRSDRVFSSFRFTDNQGPVLKRYGVSEDYPVIGRKGC